MRIPSSDASSLTRDPLRQLALAVSIRRYWKRGCCWNFNNCRAMWLEKARYDVIPSTWLGDDGDEGLFALHLFLDEEA